MKFEKHIKSAVKRCFFSVEPRIIFDTRQLLPETKKDVLPSHHHSNVIYQFVCHCNSRYEVALLFTFLLLKLNLLLLLAFPFSQGWPQRIIILQTFLFSTSVSFAPTSPKSSFTRSTNLLFGLPLLLFPSNSISIIFPPTFSWSLLMTCPYHLSLPPSSSFLTVLP